MDICSLFVVKYEHIDSSFKNFCTVEREFHCILTKIETES